MPHDHDSPPMHPDHAGLLEFIERIIEMATSAEIRALAAAQKPVVDGLIAALVDMTAQRDAAVAAQGLTAAEQADLDAAATDITTNTGAMTAATPAAPVVPAA